MPNLMGGIIVSNRNDYFEGVIQRVHQSCSPQLEVAEARKAEYDCNTLQPSRVLRLINKLGPHPPPGSCVVLMVEAGEFALVIFQFTCTKRFEPCSAIGGRAIESTLHCSSPVSELVHVHSSAHWRERV
jgi:hypothetical protein